MTRKSFKSSVCIATRPWQRNTLTHRKLFEASCFFNVTPPLSAWVEVARPTTLRNKRSDPTKFVHSWIAAAEKVPPVLFRRGIYGQRKSLQQMTHRQSRSTGSNTSTQRRSTGSVLQHINSAMVQHAGFSQAIHSCCKTRGCFKPLQDQQQTKSGKGEKLPSFCSVESQSRKAYEFYP